LGIAAGAFRFLFDNWKLYRILRSAIPIRTVGRVQVLVSDISLVPFAMWRPGRARVVIPTGTLASREELSCAIKHELQHHRQKDTFWVYPTEALRAVFFLNPFIHLWVERMGEFQELACDEGLIARGRITPQVYGRCLLKAAENALKARCQIVGTASMAAGTSKQKLKRRIEMLFQYRRKESSRALRPLILGTLCFLTTAAVVSRSAVTDRRVSLEEARKLASRASADSSFPITVNAGVLKWLNYFLGTPQGREHAQKALANLPVYRAVFDDKLARYAMPEELLGVALVESGFKNLPKQKHPTQLSAGVWQFIASTARHFGLKVNAGTDERLDVEKETDAAMRYLDSLYLRFQDWNLAIASYNQGESAIQRAIDETGERDPWKLYEQGKVADYLPEVMAAVILLKNPGALR
jgi:hypothetical protein